MKKRVVAGVLMAVILFCTACGKVEKLTAEPIEQTEVESSEQTLQDASGDAEEGKVQDSQTDEEENLQESASKDDNAEASVSAESEAVDEDALSEEDLEQYLAQLTVATHKENYAESLCEVIAALPAEKPESSLKQKDVDCDTLQWFNATYAMFTKSCHWDYHYIAGISDEDKNQKDYIKEQLDSSWGITDRQTMVDTLSWLAAEGHAPEFATQVQMLDMIGLLEGSDEEIQTAFAQLAETQGYSEEDAAFLQEYYINIRDIYSICGENGIDAWDYCRITQLCGGCYYAGYMTLEESLTVQLAVANAIQDEFASWQEMNDSYYYGYTYWQNNELAVSVRKTAYDDLMQMEKSPFKILDFDMPLEKFW